MNQTNILDILKNIEDFKGYKNGDEIEALSLLKVKTFLEFPKTVEYIFSNINLLSTYPVLEEQKSIILIDILVFNRIIEYVGKSEIQLITLFTMLKNKSDPNYDMLPKIYASKVKLNKILDLLFNDDPNLVLGLFRLIEYIKQREFTLEDFLVRLIKSRCIIWTLENEKKSTEWYISFFDETQSISETIENIEKLFSE